MVEEKNMTAEEMLEDFLSSPQAAKLNTIFDALQSSVLDAYKTYFSAIDELGDKMRAAEKTDGEFPKHFLNAMEAHVTARSRELENEIDKLGVEL